MTGPSGARSGPGASLSSVRRRALITVTGLLAVAAAIVVVVSDDARWLRVAVVAALWATLLVVVATGRRVPREASDAPRVAGRRELAVERSAERGAEKDVDREVEREAEREELAALRDEVERLRARNVPEPHLRVVGGAGPIETRPAALRAVPGSAPAPEPARPREVAPPDVRALRPVPPPAPAPAALRSTPGPAPAPGVGSRSRSTPVPAASYDAAPVRPLRPAGSGWGTGPGGVPAGPPVVPPPAAPGAPPPGRGAPGQRPVAPAARVPEWSDGTGRSFTDEPPRTGGTGSRTVAELIAAHAAERDVHSRRR